MLHNPTLVSILLLVFLLSLVHMTAPTLIYCEHAKLGNSLFVYRSDSTTDAVFDFYTGTWAAWVLEGWPEYWLVDTVYVRTIVAVVLYYFMMHALSEISLKFGEYSIIFSVARRMLKCSMLAQAFSISTTIVLFWREYFSYEVFQFFCQRPMILLQLSLIFLPVVFLVAVALVFCADRGIIWYIPEVTILLWQLVPAVLHVMTDGWYNIDFCFVNAAEIWAPGIPAWRIGIGPYKLAGVLNFANNIVQEHEAGQEMSNFLLRIVPFSCVVGYLGDLDIYESRIFGVFLVTLWMDPSI